MNRLAHEVLKLQQTIKQSIKSINLQTFLMLGDTSCIAAPTSRAFAPDLCPFSPLAQTLVRQLMPREQWLLVPGVIAYYHFEE